MDHEFTLEKIDWSVVAHNIRFLRLEAGLTQQELATEVGLDTATIYRIEKGHASRKQTLERICRKLRSDPVKVCTTKRLLNVKTPGTPYVLHLSKDTAWYSHFDRRHQIPVENQELIQDSQERSRLASLGLVGMFQSTPNFVMPSGPNLVFEEICGVTPYGPTISYKDFVLYCARGEVILRVGDEEILLTVGSAFGYSNGLNFTAEPAKPIGSNESPPLLVRVRANPIGPAITKGGPKRRARARRRKALGH